MITFYCVLALLPHTLSNKIPENLLTFLDVHVSYHLVFPCTDALGATLAAHLDKPRVYLGCMKSGEVFSEL